MKRLFLGSLLSCIFMGQLCIAASNSGEDARRAEQLERVEKRRLEDERLATCYAQIPSLQQQCTRVLIQSRLAPVPSELTREDLEGAAAQIPQVQAVAQDVRNELNRMNYFDTTPNNCSIDGLTQLERINKEEQKLIRSWYSLDAHLAQLRVSEDLLQILAAGHNQAVNAEIKESLGLMVLPSLCMELPKWILMSYLRVSRLGPIYERHREQIGVMSEDFFARFPEATDAQVKEGNKNILESIPGFMQKKQELKGYKTSLDLFAAIAGGATGYILACKGEERQDRRLTRIGMTLEAQGAYDLIQLTTRTLLPEGIRLLGREILAQRAQACAPFLNILIAGGLLFEGSKRADHRLIHIGQTGLGRSLLSLALQAFMAD